MPQAALAVLLLRRDNAVVSSEELAKSLYGEKAVEADRERLMARARDNINRVRQKVGKDIITSEDGGWRLRRDDEDLDADRFERLVREGRAALDQGDAGRAAVRLGDALAEWQGDGALRGLEPSPFVDDIRFLERLRDEAEELQIAAELEFVQPDAPMERRLLKLLERNPRRDRLWHFLTLMYYRSGNEAAALDVYRQAFSPYKEVGLPPPDSLRELHERVAARDPTLDLVAPPPRAGGSHQVLEPPVIPVGKTVSSPVRLIGARSGVVPYTARPELLTDLRGWVGHSDPFGVCLIGGHAGSGKTRLGVELCRYAAQLHWINGFLPPDQISLQALGESPAGRLVLVDYAESRVEQLTAMLTVLMSTESAKRPVRVVLLVRVAPPYGQDWTAVLRHRTLSYVPDAALDEARQWILDDMPLQEPERKTLFEAACQAFTVRMASRPTERSRRRAHAPADTPTDLSGELFKTPLMVVIAALDHVHGSLDKPQTRVELLDALLYHEQRYWMWMPKGKDPGPGIDEDLQRRVVALATLTGAASEQEAVGLLRLIPDLEDASAQLLGVLARWVHKLYPSGPDWWNPLEPDLVGEHLIATAYADTPTVLARVLARNAPTALGRSLDIYARLARDHPDLRDVLQPVLSEELTRLCRLAVDQRRSKDRRELVGHTTLAVALNRAVGEITVDPKVIPDALACLPHSEDDVLGELRLTLQFQLTEHLRGDHHLTT